MAPYMRLVTCLFMRLGAHDRSSVGRTLTPRLSLRHGKSQGDKSAPQGYDTAPGALRPPSYKAKAVMEKPVSKDAMTQVFGDFPQTPASGIYAMFAVPVRSC